MAILRVKNRDFQRATGAWLQKAREGNTVIILGAEGPPLTLQAGSAGADKKADWDHHISWLRKQPSSDTNPVDDLRREETR